MLVHERFVYLHLPKTGGTFIADALERELSSDAAVREIPGKHTGWDGIPDDAAGRPVLVYVRNPWDWYVSWYHFKLTMPRTRDQFFNALSADGRLDFAATVRNACLLVRPITRGHDLYTSQFLASVGSGLDSELLTIGRFESLVDDLERFLGKARVRLSDGALARIRAQEPLNASDRRSYRDYYDDELRDLVGESCRTLIERFEYRF